MDPNRKLARQPAAGGPANPFASKSYLRFAPIGVILAGLILVYALGWHERLSLNTLGESRETLQEMAADNPVMAPVGYIALYALAIAFSLPAGAVLTVISGFLFGWLAGALYAIVAATIGGAALFLAARTALAGFFRNRTGGMAARLAEDFERGAFSYILVLRLAPFIPFFMVSVAPALFNVRLKPFLAATVIGALPGALAYAWLGRGVDSVLVAAQAAGEDIGMSDLITPEITVAFLALTLVAALAAIVRKVRRQQAS
ncbi:TVP38/TMEM64 family protein [Mesorhizobium sp. KR9-304]|uniref:TVP38/TMEM64 family protein n=1 Tax=Mesorhizobium sp. KR9-304 TaxID=3156614 RepID=UPI0032B39BFE